MTKKLIPNNEFLESWNEDELFDFLTTPKGIPTEIFKIVRNVYPSIDRWRVIACVDFPENVGLDQEERSAVFGLSKEESDEYTFNSAMEFLEEYPQFKPMISGVEEI